MLSVGPAQYVACVLNDDVLEPPTGSEKRPLVFTRESNHDQRTFHAAIRTRWHAPQSVEIDYPQRVQYLVCWNPFVLNGDGHFIAGQPKSNRNRPGRRDGRIVVTDQANACHGFYCSQPLAIADFVRTIIPMPIKLATSGITTAGAPMTLIASERK